MRCHHLITLATALAALAGCGSADVESYPARADDGPVLELLTPGRAPVTVRTSPNEAVIVRILSPGPDERVSAAAPIEAQLQARGIDVFPGGPMLRAVLDASAPVTIVDPKGRLALGKLAPGTHTLRAFAVGPDGFVLGGPRAFTLARFQVGPETDDPGSDPMATAEGWAPGSSPAATPVLTLNHPAERVRPLADGRVPLDFIVANARLGDAPGDVALRYAVDGERERTTTSWSTIWLKGLAPGKHRILARLVDQGGGPIEGPFADAERTFEVLAPTP